MATGAGDISPAGAEASLEGLPSALLGKILERLPLSCSAFVALACRALADNVRGEEPLWKRLAARGEGRDALDAPPDLDSVMAAELPAGLPSWRAYVEMLHRQVFTKSQTRSCCLPQPPLSLSRHACFTHGASP